VNKGDRDIADSLRRFRRYGRPQLGEDQVFNYGPFDHDGNPREPWEVEEIRRESGYNAEICAARDRPAK